MPLEFHSPGISFCKTLIRYNEPLAANGTTGYRQKLTGIIVPPGYAYQIEATTNGTLSVAATIMGFQDDGSGNKTYFNTGNTLTSSGTWVNLINASGGEAVFSLNVTNLSTDACTFSAGIGAPSA